MGEQLGFERYKVHILRQGERLSFIPKRVDIIYVVDDSILYIGDGKTPGGVFLASSKFKLESDIVSLEQVKALIAADPGLLTDIRTITLSNGDNNINHGLNKEIVHFSVKNSAGDFINVTGSVVDLDNFNINLAGGGPLADSVVTLIYNKIS